MSNKYLRHALEQAEDDVTQLLEEKGSYLFLIEKLREENEMLKKNIEVPDIMLRNMETIEQLREENERLRKIIESADYLLSDAQPNDRVANRDAWVVARAKWFHRYCPRTSSGNYSGG